MKQIIRVEKLRTFGEISASAEHTNRERLTKNADPKLTPNNVFSGAKTSQEVVQAIKKRLENVKVNDDSVLCFEYLVTASPEFFESKTPQEIEKYWEKTDAWMAKRHGKSNIVGSALHLDEKTPHKVYYIVPLIETQTKQVKRSVFASMAEFEAGEATLDKKGKPRKIILVDKLGEVRLSAKTFNGGREKMSALQTDFYENVAKGFGLERGVKGSKAKHEDVKHFYGELEQKMKAAEVTIEEGIQVDSTLKKRAVEVQLKEDSQAEVTKRLKAANEILRKQAEDLNTRQAALSQREKILAKAEAWIQSQKKIIADAFPDLPSWLQEKLSSAFKVKKALEVAKATNPTSSTENTPKAAKKGLPDVFKSPVNTGNHQKLR